MMSSEETVYDPIDAQLKALTPVLQGELNLAELSNPQVVQLIIAQQSYNLIALKQSQIEVIKLKDSVEVLRKEREDLLVKIASKNERGTVSWIEIPISFLAGFAVNILTENYQSGLGWFLLVISLIILLFMRLPDLKDTIQTISRRGDK